jgi:flagellar biosynthesis anti-sigma factor FlgM
MSSVDKTKSGGILGGSVGVSKSGDAQATKKSGNADTAGLIPLSKKLLDTSVGVELSAHSKEKAAAHRKAFEIAKSTPEIREDRVAELRKKIASGEYHPDAEKITDGIMREAIMEQLASMPDEV